MESVRGFCRKVTTTKKQLDDDLDAFMSSAKNASAVIGVPAPLEAAPSPKMPLSPFDADSELYIWCTVNILSSNDLLKLQDTGFVLRSRVGDAEKNSLHVYAWVCRPREL